MPTLRNLAWPGAVLGVALFAAILGALYLGPWRVLALDVAGRDFPALKHRLDEQYLSLQEREQQIAASQPVPEVLKSAQEKAWREYTEARSHLMEWLRTQSGPSLHGFGLWASDLWIWLAALGLAFPAGGAMAGRTLRRAAKPGRSALVETRREERQAEILSQMQSAARRISEITAVAAPEPKPAEAYAPREFQPEPLAPMAPPKGLNLFQPPDPIPPEPTASEREVKYVEGLDDLFRPQVFESPGNIPEVRSPNALTMEDEPAGEAEPSPGMSDDPDNPSAWGKMPETTEFEKLERQREEVMRCARKGMTPSEIARRLRMSQDQVELIIRMKRGS